MRNKPGNSRNYQSRPAVPAKRSPGWNICLTPPWDAPVGSPYRELTQNCIDASKGSPNEAADFIRERTRLHELFIREEAKNKRIGMVLVFSLIILAALVVVFAPEGRQKMSYWVGAALLVFASGASGFGRIWGRARDFSFGADQHKPGLNE